MAAKVILIREFTETEAEVKDAPVAEAPAQSSAGWDPYEVWRTRVLLPRMEEDQPEEATAPAKSAKPSLLKRLRAARKS